MLKAKQSIMKSNEISKKIEESGNKINKFKNHIYELKEFSVEELKQRNYNDDQIEAIKTYDGSEEKSIKAAATIKFTVKKNTFSYNSKTGLTTVKALLALLGVEAQKNMVKMLLQWPKKQIIIIISKKFQQ